MKKKPFHIVRFRELKNISEKAIAIKCYDGSEAVLPKSQIHIHPFKDDVIFVPRWLIDQKQIQFKEKATWI
tara:strand:+ start:2722 stop:2934 length:213 start_codon:yes stop_codon:yes gene_type:complete